MDNALRSLLSDRSANLRQLFAREPSNGKIGILYQNDDYGKDYVKGLKEGLGSGMKVVADLSYESAEPTIYSELTNVQASGTNIFFDVTSANLRHKLLNEQRRLVGSRFTFSIASRRQSVLFLLRRVKICWYLVAIYLKDATDPIEKRMLVSRNGQASWTSTWLE